MTWRRSYSTPPPPIEPGSEYSQDDDARYAALPPEARPATECLADVVVRMLPYWYDAIVPDLRPVKTGGEYLDPDAAAAAIEAVKNQGKK